MSKVHRGRLIVAFLAGSTLASCQSQRSLEPSDSIPAGEEMVLDFSAGLASASGEQHRLIDCSDSEFSCFEIEDVATASFPRQCDIAKHLQWSAGTGRLRMVAPMAHYGAPYGSYVSDAYPNAIILYRYERGFSEIRIVRAPPSSPDFDINDFERRYVLRASEPSMMAGCRD